MMKNQLFYINCDLCGQNKYHVLETQCQQRPQVVCCDYCGLIYCNPRFDDKILENFYDEDFDGDAGSLIFDKTDVQSQDKRALSRKKEKRRAYYNLKIIKKYTSLDNKNILNVRSRTGQLSLLMQEAGAKVLNIDYFDANLNAIQSEQKISLTHKVSPVNLHQLSSHVTEKVDIVCGLTIHVAAHLLSIKTFLSNAYDLLNEGGLLFLDEKNVLKRLKKLRGSLFGTGPHHLFFLTPHIMKQYILQAGFEIIKFQANSRRKSAFRHMLIVARKPTQPKKDYSLPKSSLYPFLLRKWIKLINYKFKLSHQVKKTL